MHSSMVHHQPQLTTNNSCHHRAPAFRASHASRASLRTTAYPALTRASPASSHALASWKQQHTYMTFSMDVCFLNLCTSCFLLPSSPCASRAPTYICPVPPSPLLLFYYSKPEEVLKEKCQRESRSSMQYPADPHLAFMHHGTLIKHTTNETLYVHHHLKVLIVHKGGV